MASVTLNITDAKGKAAGSVEAPADIFGISAEDVHDHIPLIHQVVLGQLAAARQGTHSAKTRAEVSGGGRKPWKQKGTGRARQGSIRSPQWAGGGVAHGPVPRDYSQKTPKKMKAAALRYVLSDRTNAGRTHIIDFGIGEQPSTKSAMGALVPVVAERFTTIVFSRDEINEWLSVRNLPTVHTIFADQLNTYDVVTAEDVVFTKEGFNAFIEAKNAAKAETAKEA
ncbi:50S ribosomal protein L4 [Bombiscardovia apis]|uniref:Large ribosomal subunit protein uL4 n=1 Tax=Bombiscardovia apis TaxID=2932182 RepID=A0ABN6SGM4_9BIFI|nr:50S ribosomal protein L4 [Bombiscardovia apis]BDR55155.1 50S ribosomal protein L4 [Bombiscardovia apis]